MNKWIKSQEDKESVYSVVQVTQVSRAGTPLSVEIDRKDAYEATIKFDGLFWISRDTEEEFITELKSLIEKHEI